jgi:hypothetical protein
VRNPVRTATLLGVLLRLLLLAPIVSVPLWYDENFTALMVRSPLANMLTAAAGDVHPPLYYLMLWPLGQVHDLPTWVLRLPALLCSIASLFVFEKLARYLVPTPRLQLAAVTVYSLSSTAMFYASESRMYGWLGLLVLLGVLCLLEGRWVWLGIVTVLMLWSHNYGIFYAATIWLAGVIWSAGRFPGMFFGYKYWLKYSSARYVTLAIGIACLTFLPWVLILAGQMAAIHGQYWMTRISLGSAIYEWFGAFVLQGSLKEGILYEVTFFGWFFFATAWALSHRSKAGSLLPWIFVLVPFGLAVLGSVLWQPILLYRALTPCAPFMAMILVRPLQSLEDLQPRPARIWFLLAMLLLLPATVTNILRFFVPGNIHRGIDDQMVLDIQDYIDEHWQAGDVIVHQGDGTWVDSVLYSEHSQVKLPDCGYVRGALSPLTRSALGMATAEPSMLTGSAWGMVPTGRTWYISEANPMTPACADEATAHLVGDTEPIYCFRDDPVKKNCLYLLETVK